MTLLLSAVPVATGGPLYQAYAGQAGEAHNEAVRGFFDYDPWRVEAGEAARRASAVGREWRGDRAALAETLKAFNAGLGAHPAAIAAAARLAEPGALAVVAGQQAGLFTGPLYTVYKALGAVGLARRLESVLHRPVVPVFWAATEDHDLDEADHAWLPDAGGAWHKVRYVPLGLTAGISVGAVPLQHGPLERVLDRLASLLPGGYAGPRTAELATATASGASTLGGWFCRLAAALFGQLGLPVADPMEPGLRALAAPGVRRILALGPAVERALGQGVARVESVGLPPQVRPVPGEAHLFFYPQGPSGPRQALIWADGCKLAVRGGGAPASLDHYLALAGERPELFGGNVATRPLLQDEIFPTLAYVAGPGEVAYYGQYQELYRAAGRTMPLVWPRPSATIITPAVRRHLERHGLALEGLPGNIEARRNDLLRAADEVGAEALVQELRQRISEAYEPALPALASLDEVLGRLAVENRRRVMEHAAWLAKKTRQVLTQRCRTGIDQLERVRSALWPRGLPQERVASVLLYLAYYGPALIEELEALPTGPPFVHHYVTPAG